MISDLSDRVAEKMMSLYTESFPEQVRHSLLKGFMGKFFSAVSLGLLIVACALLPSCGSSSPTRVSPEIPPTGVSLSPGPNLSLEVGEAVSFTAAPAADTFAFQSSNPTVVTIANNGEACAGTWNSLTLPLICTPGPVGIAQVTASSLGVTSSPVTIYVHAPVTSIAISKVPGQPQTLSDSCISKGPVHGPERWLFQATAFNGSTDITSSVGPFSWQQINPGTANIVTLATPPNGTQGCLLSPQGQCLNQQAAIANTPGVGQIYATTSGLRGQPISIETCRVHDISIAAAGDPPSTTSFLVNSGTSTTLNATVTDTVGLPITDVPLTWSTSNPVSVGASVNNANNDRAIYGSVGTATASGAGQATVIASCTPPSCNAGIKPSLPIYPQAAFNFDVQGTSTATANPIVYATTTACGDQFANPTGATCNPTLVPVTRSSSTSPFAAGSPVVLPTSPNSFVFDNSGGSAYLGVDLANFGQQGLMIFSGSAVTQVRSAPGKVLAISPDKNSAIISDTADTPNKVFVCTNCTTSRTVTTLLINGATAAAFSPDSLKAYILAGSNLYVYSKLDPLQTIALGGAANDVAFHPEGGFAYLAGPSTSITPYRTCDNALISGGTVSTANNPLIIRALPDGSTLLVLDPPNIDLVSVTSLTSVLCTGTVTDTTSSFNLGQGSFIPTQFFVSPDGSTAYIIGETQAGPPPSRLPFVMVFNVNTQTTSVLSLSNNATPLSASLAPDGKLLFVGADDGTLHVIDTTSGLDTQQVTFPFPTNELCFGPGSPPTQVPLSQVRISNAAQSGSNTNYTYTLISGASLKVGESITVANVGNGGDNGTFAIAALGPAPAGTSATGTFTVNNSLGVTANNQSGVGTVPIPCNPDLVAVRP
jgi:hypothetical protein